MKLGTATAQVDLLEDTKTRGAGLYTDMAKNAKYYTEEWTRNPTGDRLKSAKQFVAEKAGIDFDSKYGAFNANRSTGNIDDLANMEYGQFAIKTIGKIPETEQDHKLVRDAYITKMGTYVPEKTKDINEVSAYKVAQDAMKFAYKVSQDAIRNSNRGGGGSGGGGSSGGGNNENVIINGSTIMRVKNKNGQYGYYQQEGLMMRGQAGKGDNAETVFIQPFWNPNANGKKGGVYYGIAKPTEGGGYTMESLGGKMNGDAAGIQEARKYLSQSDFNKLAKEAAMYYSNPALRKAGQYLKEVDRRFTEVDFSEIGGSSGKKVTRVR